MPSTSNNRVLQQSSTGNRTINGYLLATLQNFLTMIYNVYAALMITYRRVRHGRHFEEREVDIEASIPSGTNIALDTITIDFRSPRNVDVEAGVHSGTNVLLTASRHVQFPSATRVLEMNSPNTTGTTFRNVLVTEPREDVSGTTNGDTQLRRLELVNQAVVGDSETATNGERERPLVGVPESVSEENGENWSKVAISLISISAPGLYAFLDGSIGNQREHLTKTPFFIPCLVAICISFLSCAGLLILSNTGCIFQTKMTIMKSFFWGAIVSTILTLGLVVAFLLQRG